MVTEEELHETLDEEKGYQHVEVLGFFVHFIERAGIEACDWGILGKITMFVVTSVYHSYNLDNIDNRKQHIFFTLKYIVN